MVGPYLSEAIRVEGQVGRVMSHLDSKDRLIDRGTRAEVHAIEGRRGERLTVAMDAVVPGELDPYLYLYRPDGRLLAEDDDGGEGLNALISIILGEDGEVLAVATTYSPEQGAYSLTVRRGAPTTQYPRLDVPSRTDRRFDGATWADEWGNPYHVYAMPRGDEPVVAIRMDSPTTQPRLLLYDAVGAVVAESEGAEVGEPAEFTVELGPSSVHYLVATTSRPPDAGPVPSYHLTVRGESP